MSILVTKPAIDLGIVTNNLEAMLGFYRDTLGLESEAAIPMLGGGVMNRFKVGESAIKIIETDPKPAASAAPGGIRGATGYRYWTITVSNLADCVARAAAQGSKIVVPAKVIRPGVTIAIIADPDGNWVELLELS
ncbi:MAG: VOC family protein [Gammaproteobacteria bacterium]|nr:VOC family protein [Gammaproteobacteria bacterium]